MRGLGHRSPEWCTAHFSSAMERRCCYKCSVWKDSDCFSGEITCRRCVAIERRAPFRAAAKERLHRLIEQIAITSAEKTLCKKCGEIKIPARVLPSGKPESTRCLSCRAVANKKRAKGRPPAHKLQWLLRNARKHPSRVGDNVPPLTHKGFTDAYETCEGVNCFFPGNRPSLELHSEWGLALTRKDITKPMSDSNLAITSMEFIVIRPEPWTDVKIKRLVDRIGHTFDWDAFNESLSSTPGGGWGCDNPAHERRRDGTCRPCTNAYERKLASSGKGFFRAIAVSIHQRARKDGKRCDVTVEKLLVLLRRQNGLCAYSFVPMVCRRKAKDFQLSVEHIDPTGEHTMDNLCFVILELNTVCNRDRTATGPGQSSQWTKAKFWQWMAALEVEQPESAAVIEEMKE